MAFVQELTRPVEYQVYATTEDLGDDYFREPADAKLKKRGSVAELSAQKRPKIDKSASEPERIERRRQDALIMVIKAGWSLHQGENQIIQFDDAEDRRVVDDVNECLNQLSVPSLTKLTQLAVTDSILRETTAGKKVNDFGKGIRRKNEDMGDLILKNPIVVLSKQLVSRWKRLVATTGEMGISSQPLISWAGVCAMLEDVCWQKWYNTDEEFEGNRFEQYTHRMRLLGRAARSDVDHVASLDANQKRVLGSTFVGNLHSGGYFACEHVVSQDEDDFLSSKKLQKKKELQEKVMKESMTSLEDKFSYQDETMRCKACEKVGARFHWLTQRPVSCKAETWGSKDRDDERGSRRYLCNHCGAQWTEIEY